MLSPLFRGRRTTARLLVTAQTLLLMASLVAVAPAAAAGTGALDLGSAGAYVTFGDPAKLDLGAVHDRDLVQADRDRRREHDRHRRDHEPRAAPDPRRRRRPRARPSTPTGSWASTPTGNVIAADFEGIDDPAPTGQNTRSAARPPSPTTCGTTPPPPSTGPPGAVYLDGNLEASSTPGFHPRSDSTQGVALGAMIQSGVHSARPPVASQGVLDEARVWNVARTGPEILATKNSELTSGTGLVARWGLDEGSGTAVNDSIATAANGTITGTGYARASGFMRTTPRWPSQTRTRRRRARPRSWRRRASLRTTPMPNGNPLTAILVTDVSHGVLALAANGGFTYTPTDGYSGPDSFTYKANDGDQRLEHGHRLVGGRQRRPRISAAPGRTSRSAIRPSSISAQFTIETWFKRTGTGVAEHDRHRRDHEPRAAPDPRRRRRPRARTSTPTGSSASTPTRQRDRGRLRGDRRPGPDRSERPITGTTAITDNVWHHAAATFDGTTWSRLPRRQPRGAAAPPAFHPRSDSTQGVALGAMIQSDGTADRRSLRRACSTRPGSGTWPAPGPRSQPTEELGAHLGHRPRRPLGPQRGLRARRSTDSIATARQRHDHRHRLRLGRGLRPAGAGQHGTRRTDAQRAGQRGHRDRHLADTRRRRVRS